MDSETQERVINRITSVALAGMLMLFAYLVVDARPFAYTTLGTVFGTVLGGEIATRTKKQTLRKVAQDSVRPPPNDDDDGSGTTVVAVEQDPPPPRRRGGPLRSYALALIVLGACATPPNPIAGVYGAERVRCVHEHDAAAEARECMRLVDQRYGQDGGL